ncbi:hypothetical protein LRM31_07260 [Enterobacter kobei]|uniref:hypothetical protein n=1 Tax=Enterobacter kobei TaxID=208224 RepID=UPI001BDF7E20|nr:hypothetical protein [Enterobacter kobei]MBT2109984.1 hypothetical protein [Enterobacter hormaechei subsp. xiangfangensis]UNE89209.1 hypothetical protein LRM31_07260 [Enterobacter kobei]DAY67790.1 MAG TPA: hypothetical protein [Caudoviricetes sp.]
MAKLGGVKKDLDKWKIKESDQFSKRVTKASKLASVELQRKINRDVEGPVNFTKNAVGFKFKVTKTGSENRIFIKDTQAEYLGQLIDDNKAFNKYVPTGVRGSKNQFGNIPGLKTRRNLESVKQNKDGKTRTILIKTNVKQQNKRVIAIFKRHQTRKKTIGSWTKISDDIHKNVLRVAKLKR